VTGTDRFIQFRKTSVKISVFWVVTPYTSDVSEEHISSIIRVEEYANRKEAEAVDKLNFPS
jgi:hypothetical protein